MHQDEDQDITLNRIARWLSGTRGRVPGRRAYPTEFQVQHRQRQRRPLAYNPQNNIRDIPVTFDGNTHSRHPQRFHELIMISRPSEKKKYKKTPGRNKKKWETD